MTSHSESMRRARAVKRATIWPLLLLLLIGFGLRLFSLEGQSMWTDEGLSYYRSGQSPIDILQNIIVVDGIETRDTNPPFYFLLLHFWRNLSGDTVFAMRFLTAATATLSIPLMYLLGRRVFGYPGGLAAALFLAVSPFHVWQSQIVRNYGLLVTLNLFSIYALYCFLFSNENRPQRRWFVLWLVSALIGIYTHYFGFFLFAFGIVCLGVAGLYRQGAYRLLRQPKWWLVLGVMLLAIVPVTVIALDRFRAGQQVDFYYVPLPKFLHQALSAFSVGMERSLVHEWWRIIPVVLLVLVGLWLGWRGRRQSLSFLVGYQLLPLGILYTLSFINPLYNGTRHLLIGLPPFLLLAAGGVALAIQNVVERPSQLSGRLSAAAVLGLGIFLLASQSAWLHSQFTSPLLVRDDVRGAAEYLNKMAAPDDLIILHDTLIRFTFDYYYHGAAPVTAVPEYGLLNPEATMAALQEKGQGASLRLWFLTEPQPRNGFDRVMLSDWAADNWLALYEQRFPAMWLPVNLIAYDSEPVPDAVPEAVTLVDAAWPGYFDLLGSEIPSTLYAGSDWWLAFYWNRTDSDVPLTHDLSFRLTDMDGRVWAGWDQWFQREFRPADWPLQETIRSHHRLEVPAGLPPGQYQLWLGLNNWEVNQLEFLADGRTELLLANVVVQAAACDSSAELPSPLVAADATIGRIVTLNGFALSEEQYRPGHQIPVQALWCVRRRPDKDYLLRLQLNDMNGEVVAESFSSFTRPDYPPTQWQKDELLMGHAALIVPAWVETGRYEMAVSVVDPESKEPLPGGLFGERAFSLGTVEITAWPLVSEFPAIESSLRADFGEPLMAELHGYELIPSHPQLGESLTLTLFWRSRSSTIGTSYAVFVHLEDETGQIIGQGDGLPVQGFRPTISWRDGEVIVDEHVVAIPEWAAPGNYRLWVGFYEPGTNLRPPALVDGAGQPDGRLLLTEITVEP